VAGEVGSPARGARINCCIRPRYRWAMIQAATQESSTDRISASWSMTGCVIELSLA
jgi:hypothetical protein